MKQCNSATSQSCLELCIQVGKQLYKLFDRRLEGLGLTPVQLQVLHALAVGEGLAMSELSKQLCCVGSNITAIVGRMTEAGWVKRRRDPHDRRVSLVQITRRGRALLAAATEAPCCGPAAADWLTAGEWRELCRILGKLLARL